MAMDKQDYEQIKNEYKAHYKKLQEMKNAVMNAKHTKRISDALENMDPKPILNSVDELIDTLKVKAIEAEAKLESFFSNYESSSVQTESDSNHMTHEMDEFERQQAIKRNIDEIKQQLQDLKNTDKNESTNSEKSIGSLDNPNDIHKEIKSVLDAEPAIKTLGPKPKK